MSEFVRIWQIPFQNSSGGGGWGRRGCVINSTATVMAGTYNASKYIYTRILSKQRVEGGITGYCMLIKMKNKYINIKSKETYWVNIMLISLFSLRKVSDHSWGKTVISIILSKWWVANEQYSVLVCLVSFLLLNDISQQKVPIPIRCSILF